MHRAIAGDGGRRFGEQSGWCAALVAVTALVLFGEPALASTSGSSLMRVSVSSTGAQANGEAGTGSPAISPKGRYVAFEAGASNLVPRDTNGTDDVFIRDVLAGRTQRVSVSSTGAQGNGPSYAPAIGGAGRYLAFVSDAANLVPRDTNATTDVFLRDVVAGRTQRVSVSSTGAQGNGFSFDYPAVSANGRYVAFISAGSNLVRGDTNMTEDVFVHDTLTGRTRRVSVSSTGTQGNGFSLTGPAMSRDGRYIAFVSTASNLVPRDTNNQPDVFVHDMVTGRTRRANLSSRGAQANYGTYNRTAMSANGRLVVFTSGANNLVPGDTNDNSDVFVHDTITGRTRLVSVNSRGVHGNGGSDSAGHAISADGRYVTFDSGSSNLAGGDPHGIPNVFRHDLIYGLTKLLSVSDSGAHPNNTCGDPAVSADGQTVAFLSYASNLVPRDTNGASDTFLWRSRQ